MDQDFDDDLQGVWNQPPVDNDDDDCILIYSSDDKSVESSKTVIYRDDFTECPRDEKIYSFSQQVPGPTGHEFHDQCEESSSQPIQESACVKSESVVKKSKPRSIKTVNGEFFGVYCLISRSPNKYYKNRCYIGYTVDPNRRIRQHNAGKDFGGARKTDSRGPWDMVCIVHGFPNNVSALRFEWAWQNPDKSRRIRALKLRKTIKESPFHFKLRIVCHMLNSDPWNRLSLKFRWLLPEMEVPFPQGLELPKHMVFKRGPVEKNSVMVPASIEFYIPVKDCGLCLQKISSINELVRCAAMDTCTAHFHMKCLAKHSLKLSSEYCTSLFPINGNCPQCNHPFLWGDLIRDQRLLLAISKLNLANHFEIGAQNLIPNGKLFHLDVK